MKIQTDRLELIALTEADLALYLAGENLLEAKLGLAKTGRMVIAGIRARVERTILKTIERATGDDYLFLTFWIVVTKNDNKIVAELGFKGLPDKKGCVEIGYGTLPETRNRGFMTEAVQALTGWAVNRPEVLLITAETDKENLASIRVLEKSGFTFMYNRGNMKWWQLPVTKEKESRYNYAG